MEKGNLKGVLSEVNAIQSFDTFFQTRRSIQSRETLREERDPALRTVYFSFTSPAVPGYKTLLLIFIEPLSSAELWPTTRQLKRWTEFRRKPRGLKESLISESCYRSIFN